MINTIEKKYYPYWFVVPGLAIYFIFFVAPNIMAFFYSFTDWSLLECNFIGLQNFYELFSNPSYVIAFKNTILFTIFVTVFKMAFGFLLALLLNMEIKSKGYLRTIFYLPCILSTLAVGLIFSSLYHPTNGLINKAFEFIGLGFLAQDWLGNASIVIFSTSMVEIWKWTGFHMVIFLAGIQSIPKEHFEAASIDGANKWQTLKHIIIPMIRGAINTNFIFCIIFGLRVFEIIFTTTQGGPGYASEVINTLVFRNFSNGYLGLSTAGGLMLSIIVAAIGLPLNYYLGKKEVEL